MAIYDLRLTSHLSLNGRIYNQYSSKHAIRLVEQDCSPVRDLSLVKRMCLFGAASHRDATGKCSVPTARVESWLFVFTKLLSLRDRSSSYFKGFEQYRFVILRLSNKSERLQILHNGLISSKSNFYNGENLKFFKITLVEKQHIKPTTTLLPYQNFIDGAGIR